LDAIMATPISEQQVRHIATLGRLKLSDDEVRLFTRELAEILEYIDQLNSVDVTGVEPTAHAVAVQNVLREDAVAASLPVDAALAAAPQREGSFFRVPKVLEQDTV
jgi:aspartyl-tRNA(Asn)/glutamyl-tRNA(Gln) amidotransferase subunit C